MKDPDTIGRLSGVSALALIMVMTLASVVGATAAPRGDSATVSDIHDTAVTIGPGWALIRESRVMDLVEGEQTIVLDRIPPEADLSSLSIRSRRVPLQLMEWARDGYTNVFRGAVSTEGDSVVWRPGIAQLPGASAVSRRVRCRIRSPLSWKKIGVDVMYVVHGPSWEARYQVMVRGEQAEEKEPVSVDFTGVVTIHNPTSASWDEAAVQVVGDPRAKTRLPQNDPGFLMVDDESPLADLWRRKPEEAGITHAYTLPGKVALLPQSTTDISLVRTTRTPASRLYVMDASEVPFGTAGQGHPLRKFIVIRNSAANRMGVAIPPGRAEIFMGSARNRYLQEAWQERANVNDEIRIDLGPAADMLGWRQSLARTPAISGYYEETIGLQVLNQRSGAVLVEMREKPPLILEWAVVRTSLPNRGTGRSLKFLVEAEPGRRAKVEYQLRVRQPDL